METTNITLHRTRKTRSELRSLTIRLWTQRIIALVVSIAVVPMCTAIENLAPAFALWLLCIWLFLTREVDWDWSFDTTLARWAEKENQTWEC